MGSSGTYEDVRVLIEALEFLGDIIEMKLKHYEVILGMNWLTRPKALLDCPRAHDDFIQAEGNLMFHGIITQSRVPIILTIQAGITVERT